MRKTLQTITISALLLAPVACSPGEVADPTAEYLSRGIGFILSSTSAADPNAPLAEISIREPESGDPLKTAAGIGPGSTYADVKAAYPEATEETKQGDGGPFNTVVVVQDNLELAFLREDFSTTPISDSDVVASVFLRKHTEEMHGSC